MRIEILTIGDELLLGFTVDTNAAHLARALAALGVEVARRGTVGDAAGDIAAAVREALDRTGAVITTGGLGPTSDDNTKAAIAALFGRALRVDDALLEAMRRRWKDRGWPGELPEANRRQALIPEGARILQNNHGSAPGIWLEDERGRWVAMLPGVPREMRGMLADTLLPLVAERAHSGAEAGSVVRSLTLRTTGVSESALADRLDAGTLPVEVALAYLPGADGVDLRLTMRGAAADVDHALAATAATVRACIGDCVYGEDTADLAAVVLERCRETGARLAVAESCTGGLLGARLTAIPGSSDVVLGGIIAYDNRIKREFLDVPEALLVAHGAVSEPVVRAMAAGARRRLAADVAVAITGVAGPGGGTPEKPVGLVWVAVETAAATRAVRLSLVGDRAEIRARAAQAALNLVLRTLGA